MHAILLEIIILDFKCAQNVIILLTLLTALNNTLAANIKTQKMT